MGVGTALAKANGLSASTTRDARRGVAVEASSWNQMR
jgi:hypothetical protein